MGETMFLEPNIIQQQEYAAANETPAPTPQALEVELIRTSEPVWPEDERQEHDERSAQRLGSVPAMFADEADGALRSVRVSLPDLVLPQIPQDDAAAGLPGNLAGLVPMHVSIPMSFDAPEGLTLRRVRMSVALEAPDAAVFLWLVPISTVQTSTSHVADLGIDLGKVVSVLFPQVPDVFTAKVQTGVDLTRAHPTVQASGVLTRMCTWRVSATMMAYNFQPSLVLGTPAKGDLTLTAELHVEVRKRILGVFHRTYAKSAAPRRYELILMDNQLVPLWWAQYLSVMQDMPRRTEESAGGRETFRPRGICL